MAVTTQLINPNDLKKFTHVVRQNGQVHPFIESDTQLLLSGSDLSLSIKDIADLPLARFEDIRFDSVSNLASFDPKSITVPTFVLLRDLSDAGLTVGATQIASDTTTLIDTQDQQWNL